MVTQLFLAIGGFALFNGLWWTLQRKLFQYQVPKSIIMLSSGMGAGGLIVASFLIYGVPSANPLLWMLLFVLAFISVVIAYSFVSAVEHGDASYAVSVTAFAPVFAIGTGYLFLNELPGLLGIIGILIILAGTYVLNVERKIGRQNMQWLEPLKKIWSNRGKWLWFALAAAVAGSFGFPIEKQAIHLSNHLLVPGIHLFLGWGVFWGIYAGRNGDFKRLRKIEHMKIVLPLLCVAALCFALANASQGAAYYHGLAASVGALKRIDGPVTVILASVFLGEKKIQNRLLGTIIIAFGAFLIGID